MVKAILSVIGNVQVVKAVVIVVASARALAPSRKIQPRFAGYVGKCAVVIIVKQMAGGPRSATFDLFEGTAIHQEYVGPTVIVVIENCHAAAGGLDDELLGVDSTVYVLHLQPGPAGDIHKP